MEVGGPAVNINGEVVSAHPGGIVVGTSSVDVPLPSIVTLTGSPRTTAVTLNGQVPSDIGGSGNMVVILCLCEKDPLMTSQLPEETKLSRDVKGHEYIARYEMCFLHSPCA